MNTVSLFCPDISPNKEKIVAGVVPHLRCTKQTALYIQHNTGQKKVHRFVGRSVNAVAGSVVLQRNHTENP